MNPRVTLTPPDGTAGTHLPPRCRRLHPLPPGGVRAVAALLPGFPRPGGESSPDVACRAYARVLAGQKPGLSTGRGRPGCGPGVSGGRSGAVRGDDAAALALRGLAMRDPAHVLGPVVVAGVLGHIGRAGLLPAPFLQKCRKPIARFLACPHLLGEFTDRLAPLFHVHASHGGTSRSQIMRQGMTRVMPHAQTLAQHHALATRHCA